MEQKFCYDIKKLLICASDDTFQEVIVLQHRQPLNVENKLYIITGALLQARVEILIKPQFMAKQKQTSEFCIIINSKLVKVSKSLRTIFFFSQELHIKISIYFHSQLPWGGKFSVSVKILGLPKYSQTCSNNHLCRMTIHLMQPTLNLPKLIPIQLSLYRLTACLT